MVGLKIFSRLRAYSEIFQEIYKNDVFPYEYLICELICSSVMASHVVYEGKMKINTFKFAYRHLKVKT